MRFLRYDWAGAAVGVALPLVATLIAAWDRHGDLGLAALGAVQGAEPLLWLMDTAPFVAGTLGWALERQRRVVAEQQERIARLELQRRVAFERTAAELSGTALTLLADVSALGASTAQTNASVRGTIETMTALSQGATAVALAAETVAGRALDASARRESSAEELAATLRSAASGAKEIARIAQEQMGGIDQVLAAMNEIHFATESTAGSAREVAAEARALAKHARELRGGPGNTDDGLDALEESAPDVSVAPPPSANTEWVAAASDSAL